MSVSFKDIMIGNRAYRISSNGEIFSYYWNKTLSPTVHNGYNTVTGVGRVHRIIAEYFIDNPYDKPYVNHKNGIKTDNRVSNLEWCSAKENIKHAWENGLCTRKYGDSNPFYGKQHSEHTKSLLSKKVSCPHCGKVGGYSAMKRWHFDNCKEIR